MRLDDNSAMAKLIHFIVLALTITLLAALPLEARTARPQDDYYEDIPVNIIADAINYEDQGKNLVAQGGVEIVQGKRILRADIVKINLTTKDTHASGKVMLQEGGDVLYCDAFDINLDSQLGKVESGKVFIKEENFHIEGKEMSRLGLDSYRVSSGKITTCDGANPFWRIDSGRLDVTVEGYARARNSVMRIKGIPVLYLPYAIFPVKTKRQTGFLFPEIGQSNTRGQEFNNTFFWAINENTDATMWLDAATKKGLGTGLEYRFKLKEDTSGKFYGYFAREGNEYFDDKYREQRDREKNRGYLNFEGQHYFSPDSYVKTQASYVSDRELYGDYGSEVKRSRGEVRKASISSREKDESLLFYNRNWEFYNLSVNLDMYKNLRMGDPYTIQRLPQVVLSGMRRPVRETPLFYQFDSSYDYFWREEGQKGHRISTFPKISYPLSYQGWLKFTPEIGLQSLSYVHISDHKDVREEGLFPSARAELSTTFLRIFSLNKDWITKLKHTIEPGLLYENVPANDQRDYPEFDLQEGFYRRHSVSYYIKNRFTGLILDDTGELQEHEIGYFMFGQSYNLSQPRGGLYLKGNPDKDFSDAFTEVRLGVYPRLYFKSKAAFDTYQNVMHYYNALLSWHNQRGEYLELEYRYERDSFEGFALHGKMRLSSAMYAFFQSRYDRLENKGLDSEFGIDYGSQCWGTKITMETSGSTGGRTADTSFKVRFYLKGMGGAM